MLMYFQIFLISIFMYVILYTIGLVLSNVRVAACGNYALLGSVYLIIGQSVLSNIFQLRITFSAAIFIVLTLITELCRQTIFKKKTNKQRINANGFFLGFGFILVNFLILMVSKKIFGVANFDFFNAIQDGKFLQDNNSFDSYTNNQLLPLTWSAGIGSRYGISLILALFNAILPNISTLIIGQASLLLFSALGSTMLFKLASRIFQKGGKLIFLATLATNFSALVIYQINNQMIGQITALPVVYLILILILSYRDSYDTSVYIIISIFALYILYPSIILPVAMTILLFVLFRARKRDINFNSIIINFVTFIALYFLIYSSNAYWPFRMLMSFTLPQAGGANLNPQANLFPQLISLIGPGQFLGTIPIPYVGSWSVIILALSGLSFIVVFFQVYSLRKENYIESSGYHLYCSMFIGFIIFALYSFIAGNSYVVLKIAIWIAPLLILNLLLYASTPSIKVNPREVILKSIIGILLLCNFNVSYQEIVRMRDGKATSFPQLILPNQVVPISKIVNDNPNHYGIYLPTAEEAAWIAVNLPASSKSTFTSLGAQNQALAEIEKANCNESQQGRVLSNIKSLIVKRDIIDITPQPIANSRDEKIIFHTKEWQIGDIKSFDSFITVYSGLFPPTLNSQISLNPIPFSSSLRWSSGMACFAFHSRENGLVSLRVPVLLGPDAGQESKIVSQTASNFTITKLDPLLQVINLEQPVSRGWNFISLQMPEAYESPNPRFFRVRADSRKLRFAIGSISFSLNFKNNTN